MTAHRYWRINMTASAYGFAVGLAEVEFRTTPSVPRAFSGGTASATNSFSGYFASSAADGNYTTFWASTDGGVPCAWTYDYGAGNTIDVAAVALTSRPDSFWNQAPTVFTLQWSDDGSNWTTVRTISATWSSPGQTQVFAAVAHRYWRVFMTASAGNAYSFAEIQFRTSPGVPLAFSGGTASAYNSFSGLTPAMATDGNNATFWGSTDTTPGWWAYDYGVGNALDVVEIMLTSRPDSQYTQTPSSFTLQWSDDGSVWTPGRTISASWNSATQTQVFPVNITSNPGYANAGGTGNRTALIAVTTTATLGGGAAINLVDGAIISNASNAVWFNTGQSGREVRFDFGLFGAPRCITEATWYQDVSAVHGNWKWQGSNDGVSWSDIGAEFTLGTPTVQVLTTLAGNTGFWRYYRMLQTAGSTSNSPWLREIEFAIDNTVGLPHAAMLTQIALEEWAVNNPQAQLTQIALEQWASVAGIQTFSARHV